MQVVRYCHNNVNRVALANPNVQSYANSSNSAIDVAFLIDCRSVSNAQEYAKIKRNIIEAADTVFIKSPGSHIKIIVMNSVTDSYLNHPVKILTRKDIGAENFDGDYFLDIDEVYSALDYLEISPSKSSSDCNISDAVNYVCQTYDENYRRDLYLFCIMQDKGLYYNSNNELSDTGFKNWNIQINTAYRGKPKSQYGYARDIVYMTKGGTFNADPDFDSDSYSYEGLSDFMLKQIYNNDYKVENGYKAIIGTGYKTVVFNSSLQQNYEWSNNNMSNGSPTDDDDLDKDGLADYEEIMFKQKDIHRIYKDTVKVDSNGKVDLYTFGEIVKNLNDSLYTHKILFYVENGLERYRDATGDHTISIKSLISTRILPIKSDPTDADGDNDGTVDLLDSQSLMATPVLMEDIVVNPDDKFVVIKHLTDSTQTEISSVTTLYAIPTRTDSNYFIDYKTKLVITDIIYVNYEYWFKVRNVDNGVSAYVNCEATNKQPSDFNVVTISNIDILNKLTTHAPISHEAAAAFKRDTTYGSTYSELIKNASVELETGWLYYESSALNDRIYLVAVGTEFSEAITGHEVIPGEGEIIQIFFRTNKGDIVSRYFAFGDSKGEKMQDDDLSIVEAIIARDVSENTNVGGQALDWGSFSNALGNRNPDEFDNLRYIEILKIYKVNIDSLHIQLSGNSKYHIINYPEMVYDSDYVYYYRKEWRKGGWRCIGN